MSLVDLDALEQKFGFEGNDNDGLKSAILELQGLKIVTVAGGGAGNITVAGIATEDTLLAVINIDIGGDALTTLTSEFTISAANTINNTGGTTSAGGALLVIYADKSGH